MDALETDYAAGLLGSGEPPRLSLYQPTHRHHPDNRQDPIRFRNLVKALETSLLQTVPKDEVELLLAPFLVLAANERFWEQTLDGLAVLGARDVFRVYRLQRTVAELAVVADSFHTRPLLRILQSADRFQVLGIDRHAIRLFEGNRDALDEIEPARGVPRTMVEALGAELTEPHLTVASYGGVQGAMRHGHGTKESEVDIDAERFFRAVDQGVLEHHSRPSHLPLILAALPEHHHRFHGVSHNPFLVEESIGVHPAAVSLDELRRRAWKVLEPRYLARLAALVEDFGTARSRDLGHEDPARVAEAAVAGRVATALIEADRAVPGRIDLATGAIEGGQRTHPEVDDVLDDLAELVLQRGGQVVIVPAQRMPTRTGVAAIYRH